MSSVQCQVEELRAGGLVPTAGRMDGWMTGCVDGWTGRRDGAREDGTTNRSRYVSSPIRAIHAIIGAVFFPSSCACLYPCSSVSICGSILSLLSSPGSIRAIHAIIGAVFFPSSSACLYPCSSVVPSSFSSPFPSWRTPSAQSAESADDALPPLCLPPSSVVIRLRAASADGSVVPSSSSLCCLCASRAGRSRRR